MAARLRNGDARTTLARHANFSKAIGGMWAVVLALVLSGAAALAEDGAAPRAPIDGDADRGERVFLKCASCHMVGPGAKNRVGPLLNEVFGRRAAGVDGFKYSKDLEREGADGLVWSAEKLDVYLENPRALVTRTRMNFAGLKDPQDRADVIAYLRRFSASPQDIPEAAPTAPVRDPEVSAEILAIVGDPAYGEYLAGECLTCHQASGADKGIPSITGWPPDVFVTVMHAYKSKARPHPVMRMIASNLADDEIAALAAYFETLEP